MNLTDKELYYKHHQIKILQERLIIIIKINGKKIILGLAIALGVGISPIVASASTSHTVASGDSLWKISQEYGVTMNSIVNSNPAKLSSTASVIFPNEVLEIPTGNTNYKYSAGKSNTSTYTAPQATYAQSASSYSSYSKPAQSYSQPDTSTQTQTTSSAANYNGGSTKSYVLSQMASRTGVSASTWNYIIQRESNWQPSVRNSSSGAYGLFQNMHINGGSVQEQVNAAVSLYHSQGMGAWSETR